MSVLLLSFQLNQIALSPYKNTRLSRLRATLKNLEPFWV